MSTGSSSGSTTSNTVATPWSGQQPYLTNGFQDISSFLTNPDGSLNTSALPSYYTGQTIATPSTATTGAESMASNLATNDTVNNAAQTNLENTINGDYLNSNPYLDATYNQAAGQMVNQFNDITNPAIDSTFSGAGRYGSNSWATDATQQRATEGQQLDNLATDIYGQNYQQGVQNQLTADAAAPAAQAANYTDAGQLAAAGATQDQLNQANINSNISAYNYNSNLPLNTLEDYMSLIQGNYGGTTSTSTPLYSNSLTSGIGAGLGILGGVSSLNGLAGAGGLTALLGL